jgi:tetraacyldisaccharide 4'-kinase
VRFAPAVTVARALEEGRLRGPVARGLSRVWARVAADAVVRPLPRPPGVALVTIGGSTLGGSGKTPLAIACALELARAAARVAFVGHAYRGKPGRCRVAAPLDSLDEVGDEALVAARALAGAGVPVVVGPTRAGAVAHASSMADVLVVDGVLQTAPRASLSLLAVDEHHPWGRAQAVPPCGDLRAPIRALVEAADRIVPVGEDSGEARRVSRGVWVGEELLGWDALHALRLGLVVVVARPERILSSLRRRQLIPSVVVRARDHGSVSPSALRAGVVDLWIATPKCALHARAALGASPQAPPLAVLDHAVALGPGLTHLLRSLACLDPDTPGQ